MIIKKHEMDRAGSTNDGQEITHNNGLNLYARYHLKRKRPRW
jgi:hypothetical protein